MLPSTPSKCAIFNVEHKKSLTSEEWPKKMPGPFTYLLRIVLIFTYNRRSLHKNYVIFFRRKHYIFFMYIYKTLSSNILKLVQVVLNANMCLTNFKNSVSNVCLIMQCLVAITIWLDFFFWRKNACIALLLLLPKRKAFFGLEIKVRPQLAW